uniref:C2H2-type domain-containing protein n=1 Tax=Panagrolaimus sp. ES5 TaxID=591445 RepID=A0AC34GZF0_9BILA
NVASDEHVAQLFQYLACYSTKPKINEKDFCKYTIASGASIVAHPTHSSTVPAMIPQALIPCLQKPKVEVIVPKSEQPQPKHVQFTTIPQHEPEPIASSSKVVIKAETPIRYASNTDELIARKQSLPGAEYAAVAAKIKPISGGRSEEVEVYVRGRGRGRYVCDRCGIKCKKPSMLKKHLKSHTNIRPFNCLTCNFSFKTKGNLTKHLFSKTHRRKLEEIKNLNDNEDGHGLQIADGDEDENDSIITSENREENEKIEKRIRMESIFVNDADHNDADDEDEDYQQGPESISGNNDITYRSFGQENIIYERDTHTPPTWWTLCRNGEEEKTWAMPDLRRSCHSAPPMLEAEITQKLTAAASGITVPVYNQALPQTEPNIGLIALQQIKRDGNVSKFAESVSRGDNEAQMQLTSEVIRMTKGADSICQCPECKIQLRSRALLQKHMETAHGGGDIEMSTSASFVDEPLPAIASSSTSSIGTIGISNGGTATLINGTSLSSVIGASLPSNATTLPMTRSLSISNGRSFICVDCSLGFRSHGVLAKHLRTKNHVRQLCSLGKLPEDSMTLIRDNSSALAGVDASDCDAARISLIGIINRLRQANGTSTINDNLNLNIASTPQKPSSLECNEQLSSVSPTPRIPENSNFRERGSSLSTIPRNNKRKKCDDQIASSSTTSATSQTPRKQSRIIISSSSSSVAARSSTNSPTLYGHSNGTTATSSIGIAASNNNKSKLSQLPDINNLHTYSISDVWIPPKAEDIDIGTRFINPILQLLESPTRNGSFNSSAQSSTSTNNGFDETASDATSRSETSTPQQKSSFCIINNNNNNNNTTTTTTPIIQSTILNSTKCQICDSTFDSPNELQIHFQSEHISIRDGSYFGCPNNNCEKVYPSKESLKKHLLMHYRPGSFIRLTLKCNQCNLEFNDANNLQTHYVTHFNRPHVCTLCDAGFTTIEALQTHSMAHLGIPQQAQA